ncbi:MAG: hypothetical protein L6R39_003548 [Caloplaca ligustica]|nr:MAG: hypothetical protein L6R39_003548 [Caloplaca ligustica]
MPPVGSNAPVISINPQRKVIRLRALQLIIVFAFVGCIAAASLDPGRWTYASIKATVALGSGATALTFAISIIYIVFYNELIRHSNSYSGSQRVCYLLAHMSIDATTAVLWLLAVVAALFPKQTDFRSLFKSPPYATWIASVITAALEWYVTIV